MIATAIDPAAQKFQKFEIILNQIFENFGSQFITGVVSPASSGAEGLA